MNISQAVDTLVRTHKTRNPFEIIKGMNVILVSYPLDGVRGFYQYFQRNNIIYIDEGLTDSEKLFVCAHEIGHMILHKKANFIFMDTNTHFNTDKYENEADCFAINLLIPDSSLIEYQEYSIDQLSRIFGYKKELVELRLQTN